MARNLGELVPGSSGHARALPNVERRASKFLEHRSFEEMALERQFNFNLSPRDVMNIHRLGDAIRVVEARLAAVENDAGASM